MHIFNKAQPTCSAVEFPELINTVDELEEVLSRPYPETIEALKSLKGDFMVLGAGGKIGPSLVGTLTRGLREAGVKATVYAVSRFTRAELGDVARRLEDYGAVVIKADLTDPEQVKALPNAENVIFMVGRKFGTSEDPGATWVTNVLTSALVAGRFKDSRIVVFSTGNVYPLVPVSSGGATEDTEPGPVGEYAWSALARERVFQHYMVKYGTRGVIIRLNYACELRYGVLVDIALKVLRGEPIDLRMGYVNVIWQGDVNNAAIRSLTLAQNPPLVLNVTGPVISVRQVAEEFGKLLGKEPVFKYSEEDTALLSNPGRMYRLLGPPRVSVELMIRWIAHWLRANGTVYNLPTHYEVKDGRF